VVSVKLKTVFRCQNCGYAAAKWFGQCPDCQQWNTFAEEVIDASAAKKERQGLSEFSSETVELSKASGLDEKRIETGIGEVDNLLGGGLVKGQVVLLAGAPGIGKSTLTMQMAAKLAANGKVLYVSGEESVSQVSSRAKRLGVQTKGIFLLSETNLQKIAEAFRKLSPAAMVIDSIQTVFHPEFSGGPGTVGQVRESASELLRICKNSGAVLFLLGHVTKDGSLAGPKVLEHIVDTVLYFDSEKYNALRILRACKNRFGPTSEIGLFEMGAPGLSPVEDAGAYFSSGSRKRAVIGRAFSVALEGSRPILAEIQALVSPTRYPFPRRLATGLDLNRCQILFAALEKHLGLSLENKDVVVTVAGGIKLDDPALDLAVCASVISSARDIAVPHDTVFLGEVGILGQVASAAWLSRRLAEAARLGFSRALAPKLPARENQPVPGLELSELEEIRQLAEYLARAGKSAAISS